MEPGHSYRDKAAHLLKKVKEHASEAREYLSADLWERPRDEFEGWYARGHALIQYLGVTGRKFLQDDCQLRASALTYVTLIAIVPVLAVAMAVVKGLYPVESKVPQLMARLQNLLPQINEGFAQDIVNRLVELVGDVDAKALGAIGGITLFMTVVTALGSVEKSFNRIWNVRKARSYLRRTADYIAVVVLGAVLMATATTFNVAKYFGDGNKKPGEESTQVEETTENTGGVESGQDPLPARSGEASRQGSLVDPASATKTGTEGPGDAMAATPESEEAPAEAEPETEPGTSSGAGSVATGADVTEVEQPAEAVEAGANVPGVAETDETVPGEPGDAIEAADSGESGAKQEEAPGFRARLQKVLSGTFAKIVVRIIPVVAMFLLFSFLYFFFPNTRVRPTSAALGALTATILWQVAQLAYITFQIGVTKANVIYGTLAQLPILLAWVYLSWMIVLIGAEIASVHQLGLRSFVLAQGQEVPFSMRERAGLDILVRIGAAFRNHDRPPTVLDIARSLRIHETLAEDLLETLQNLEYVRRVDEEEPAYVPARELQDLAVYDVLEGLRNASTRTHYSTMSASKEVDGVLNSLKKRSRETLTGITIADILDGSWRTEPLAEEKNAPSESSAPVV